MKPQFGLRRQIMGLEPYAPGLSIDEIRQKYGLTRIIKMASNENPLGTSPLAAEAIRRHATEAFRYPRGGNPRLVEALAAAHGVDAARIVAGNGSDEIIDLLIRILAEPGRHSIACFAPCFSIYPIQARIAGVDVLRTPLEKNFSFNFPALLDAVTPLTRLVFVTSPDNPSGFCPTRSDMAALAAGLAQRAPECLLLIDEAYMDFATDEKDFSLLASGQLPENVAIIRTFSKSYGLAGLRLGYGILPPLLADGFRRARLPFSVNLLAEEAGLAALADQVFREATLRTVRQGRTALADGLVRLGCSVWPSEANFLLFRTPGASSAKRCFEALLARGIIIRRLQSYGLPEHLRVSVGNEEENKTFLNAMTDILNEFDDAV